MALALLYNAPNDVPSLMEWSFNHADHHTNIIRFVLAQKSKTLTPYVRDPMDPTNMAIWEYQHQIMHNQMNAALGITGQNLTGIDWNDPDDMSWFIDANAAEHLQANQILGIP